MNSLKYEKWQNLSNWSLMEKSHTADLERIDKFAQEYHFSLQDLRSLVIISRDLRQWNLTPLEDLLLSPPGKHIKGKDRKAHLLRQIQSYYHQQQGAGQNYRDFTPTRDFTPEQVKMVQSSPQEKTILGRCPVASEKTRCCNLYTLDAVERCGFDCTYCSIQSFYSDGEVRFDPDFQQKLDSLELDPQKRYHIGTGQSSDSLMWGNKMGILDSLLSFAENHPNVILEFKTKSDRVEHLLKQKPPANLLLTWSLNPQNFIEGEEHFTASIDRRIKAARRVADHGYKVGFHFHPMVPYQGWKEDYGELIHRLTTQFQPEEVVTVSLGTLTFIKPVLKMIRNRDITSRILQMPLVEAAGKFSYPLETKKELFSFAYNCFSPWHRRVFFYLCMEDPDLWEGTLGRSYPDNASFEEDMVDQYFAKMQEKK